MSDQDADQTKGNKATGAGNAAVAAAPAAPVAWKIESVAPNPDGTLTVVASRAAGVTLAAGDWCDVLPNGRRKRKPKADVEAAIAKALKGAA